MNINKAIIEGTKILQENNILNPKLDSEILIAVALKKKREYIILNLDEDIEYKRLKDYKYLIKQRCSGKPVAYLMKKKDFWNSEFEVSEGTLIPRPDTEILIQETLKIYKYKEGISVLDIGVGSGCILLSILREKCSFYGTGIDICKKSINLSRINAKKLGVNNKVKFLKSDVDNFCFGKYDLIISNPPYIKKHDIKYLEKDVNCFEPKLALDGGLEGTLKIKKVISKASSLLKKNGKLILEIGHNQKKKVTKLLKNKGLYINKTVKDYAQNDRCIISTKI